MSMKFRESITKHFVEEFLLDLKESSIPQLYLFCLYFNLTYLVFEFIRVKQYLRKNSLQLTI